MRAFLFALLRGHLNLFLDDKYLHYLTDYIGHMLCAHWSRTVTLAAIVTNLALFAISAIHLELLSWRFGTKSRVGIGR